MFKYKNKNLKITLSLVVSTMSIIMANCMDGQGSGSSSSNAPAVMWHLLEFLNNQNGIEANQSALEDRLAEVIERFDDRQLRLSNECTALRRQLDTLPELSRRLSQETHEARMDLHDYINQGVDKINTRIKDNERQNKDRYEEMNKELYSQKSKIRRSEEYVASLGVDIHSLKLSRDDMRDGIDALTRSVDKDIELLREEIDRNTSEQIDNVYKFINKNISECCDQIADGRKRVDDEVMALRLGRIDDRFKEMREGINSFHQGRLKDRNIYNENQRLAAENANLTQELVAQRVEFDRRLKALEKRGEKGSTWFGCLNGIFTSFRCDSLKQTNNRL
jgi:gas vesicle protein